MAIENFDDFYDQYQKFSIQVAFCHVRDHELAEDISQEVFTAFFRGKDRLDYSDTRRLKVLVTKATINKCIDHIRKSSSGIEVYIIDDERNWYEPADESNNPAARLLRIEERRYWGIVLNRLRQKNPMNYDIWVKTRYDGMSAAEVADEYGITPNNVCNRNLRSKVWMIREYEKICRQSH